MMMKLAKREKYLVSFAAIAIALFLIFQFLVFPFFEERKRIQRGIRAREEGLKEMVRLEAEYQIHKKGFQGIKQILARREKGFTLFSFLEKAAGESELKGHIKYMKPSDSKGTGPYKESMVEMKLEGITLNQLVGYLYRIESAENIVSIKRISIQENKKESGYLDTILQVLTFQ
jgi:general secretion pathway protein M